MDQDVADKEQEQPISRVVASTGGPHRTNWRTILRIFGFFSPQETNEAITARWTKVLGWSTVMLFFATVSNAFILSRTDDKIARQIEIMQGQLRLAEIDERPWLRVSIESFDMAQEQDGAFAIEAEMRLFNSGKSPGLRVQTAFDVVAYQLENARSQQEKLCTLAKQSVPRDFYPTIFPDAAGAPPIHVPWGFSKLLEELQSSGERGSGHMNPVLLGCAVYRFVTDGTPHHTKFAAQIGRVAEGKRFVPIEIGSLPLKSADVRLREAPLLPDSYD